MYSKREKSILQQEFWTAFGKYIAPVSSAEGLKINWINYKTGVKHLRFFMDTDASKTSIGIRLLHSDLDLQQVHYGTFLKLRDALHSELGEPWDWHAFIPDENGATISQIYKEQHGFNVYKKEDWPDIISFLKPRIVALDAFWCNWKYSFEDLA